MRAGKKRSSLTSVGVIFVLHVSLEPLRSSELTAGKSFCPWALDTKWAALDVFRRPTATGLPSPLLFEEGSEEVDLSRVKRSRGRRSGVAQLFAASLAAGSPSPSAAEAAPGAAAEPGVQMYFGQGRFWRLQHSLATLEQSSGSGRVTATSGYAGGGRARAPKQQACFHNMDFPMREYTRLGHAEVVRLSVPREEVARVTKAYFDSVVAALPAGRISETGDAAPTEASEYRCLVGLPGGANSSLFPDLLAANGDRLLLAVGQGSDPDTLGNRFVWIYDSDSFPFYQAELYHQFHDEVGKQYPQEYHQLREALLREGTLQKVNCPEKELSENGEDEPVPEDMVNGFTLGGKGSDPFEMIFGMTQPKYVPRKTAAPETGRQIEP